MLFANLFTLTVQFHFVACMLLPYSVVAAGQVGFAIPILYLVLCNMFIKKKKSVHVIIAKNNFLEIVSQQD